jgi:hypothetical protein
MHAKTEPDCSNLHMNGYNFKANIAAGSATSLRVF